MTKTKSKILSLLFACALLITSICTFSACSCGKKNKFDINAKDVYALSAFSSANYLLKRETQTANLTSNYQTEVTVDSRPTAISSEDVKGMKNCLTMFDSIISGGKVEQTTTKNTETASNLANYHFVMSIAIPNQENVKLYYNETETKTEREIEDEKEEVEVSTKLEGVMIVGATQFDVVGKREFESEGDEEESSIEFTTKSHANPLNYVTIKQSVESENGEYELEYEYSIFENGVLVQESETEFEMEDGRFELEYQLKANGVLEETVFKITKGETENSFNIFYNIGTKREKVAVVKTANGYQFTYSNGYVENVNL